MTNTACKPCSFPGPICRLHAGSALAQPNGIQQCPDPALMHSEQPPRCPLHAPNLARDPIRRSHPASVASTIEVGAAVKSA
ncbi:hypothetical protein ACVWY3_006766 [Bradyrhizobium sp. USDA 4486]